MKKEARLLLDKGIEALILSVEIFNRPSDSCRHTASLILLDHAFEMLLKAAIIEKGGAIRNSKNDRNTIGFDACLRKGISDGEIKFLTENQVLGLQAINGERDAAQHHILHISEQQLYVHMQSGFTLFSDILYCVFDKKLNEHLPERVLPIATLAPLNIETLFRFECKEIRKLLAPKTRKRPQAYARIRPLAILNATMLGEKNTQPSEKEISKIADAICSGKPWQDIFSGVAAIQLNKEGEGSAISLRISKKADVEVSIVQEGTEGASVVAIKRVNELEYYNLGLKQMCDNIKRYCPHINQTKLLALIKHLNLRNSSEYYKEIAIGSQKHKRYSGKAQSYILEQLPDLNVEGNWRKWRDCNVI